VFWVSRWLYLVIAGIAALLSSVYIVYDLQVTRLHDFAGHSLLGHRPCTYEPLNVVSCPQLIMGGKQYAISPDEYVFAALSL
jgi:FtsH-binding integral membrane protein